MAASQGQGFIHRFFTSYKILFIIHCVTVTMHFILHAYCLSGQDKIDNFLLSIVYSLPFTANGVRSQLTGFVLANERCQIKIKTLKHHKQNITSIKENRKQGIHIHLVDNFPNIQLVIVLVIKSWVREARILIIKNQEF